jgi:predicted metal-dependent HD superfamily phosphohydrolase
VTLTQSTTELVESYVTRFFRERMPKEYVYHDFTHTQDVVRACRQIGMIEGISMAELEILEIAAWFHDSGFDKGPDNHERRSADYAVLFLETLDFPNTKIDDITGCIMATKMPQNPKTHLQQIICDADLSHLGDKPYWMRNACLRQELMVTQNRVMTEEEWVNFELDFMNSHQYHTEAAKELFEPRKYKNIVQLRKQKMRLDPSYNLSLNDVEMLNKDDEEKLKWKALAKQSRMELKNYNVGRGVETMYRTTYNTHNNLSSLADQKANLMLSINTIMVSITVSVLVPQLKNSPQLIPPTIVLLCVCMTSIIFAALSTRPKITEGAVTLEDIQEKKSNLLFFGNFHNMPLEDFQWGMNEMIKDPDFQYSSMTRDLYFLGKVLAKKYRYLTYCYNFFMFGMIVSVVLFAYSFISGGTVILVK